MVSVAPIASVIAQVEGARAARDLVSDGLRSLQRYYDKEAAMRGFKDETPEDVLMLLVEEVGELAKALRTRLGVPMQETDTSRKSVRLELADCFIYLLHMANQTGIDLYAAFVEKERLNATKRWLRVDHPHGP